MPIPKARQGSLDESPSWEEIRRALSLHKIELGETQTAGSRRLTYEEFERIFYQLFLKIDPISTRRTFRLIYPAKNRDDQTRFVELAVAHINQKRILPTTLKATHLRVFGGENFRKTLSGLVKQAHDSEIDHIKKLLSSYPNNVDLVRHEMGITNGQQVDLIGHIDQIIKSVDEDLELAKGIFENR